MKRTLSDLHVTVVILLLLVTATFSAWGVAAPESSLPWFEIAPVLVFTGQEGVTATRGGVAISLSDAQAWGLEGSAVASVATGLVAENLLIDIQLRVDDELGEYTYIVRYVTDADSRINIYIKPSSGIVSTLVKSYGDWGGATELAASVFRHDNGIRVAVPTTAFAEIIDPQDVARACVDLRISHPTTEDEMYIFPGSACLHDSYSGMFSDLAGPELVQARLIEKLAEGCPVELPEPLVLPDGFGPPALHVEGNRIVDANGETVVLRGISPEDPYYSLEIDEPILKRDLLLARAWGANVVLIQVAPAHYQRGGGLEYIFNYVDNYVTWAGELGMYALVHWKANGDPWKRSCFGYPHMLTTASDSVGPVAQLAARYRLCPWVLHQVWAETGVQDWEYFATGMNILVDVVRSQNPDCLVVVPGAHIATLMEPIITSPLPQQNIVYAADVYAWVWNGLIWSSHASWLMGIWGGITWQDQVRHLLDAGYPLLLAEWGFGNPEDPFGEHPATSEDFGYPLMDFCNTNGISWIAHCWTQGTEMGGGLPMFHDYERTTLFPLGEVVKTTLEQSRIQPASTYMGPPPDYEVRPNEAANDGCLVVDPLDGEYDVSSAILRASPIANWVFSHWEGPVDHPSSPVVSVDLPTLEPVVAVFARPWEMPISPNAAGHTQSTDAVTIEGSDVDGVSTISYTAHVANDWGALFTAIADCDIPVGDFSGTDQFEFGLQISQTEGVQIFVTLFEQDGEAFTYELRGLKDSEEWEEYSVRYEQFIYGGFGSPDDGNEVLDLDNLNRVTFHAVVLDHAGQTVTFRLRSPRFSQSAPGSPVVCTFQIDDFQSAGLRSALGGLYGYDSHENHVPDAGTTSSCLLRREEDGSGNGFLAAEYSFSQWLKIHLAQVGRFDASDYQGILYTLWADASILVDFELAAYGVDGAWRTYWYHDLLVNEEPSVLQVSFDELTLQDGGWSDDVWSDLQRVTAIGFYPQPGTGTLYVDDMCFYTAAGPSSESASPEEGAAAPDSAAPDDSAGYEALREDWSDVVGDPALDYENPADVSFVIGNESADIALASYWGLSGCDVESIATGIVDDELLVDLKLREGDEIGDYAYVLRYVVDEAHDDRLNVYLNPPDGSVYLLAKRDGRWGQELVLWDVLETFEDGCQAAIPVSAFAEYFSSADIAASCVDLKLIHPSAQNEVFVYPGTGCLSSGRDASNSASEQNLVLWDELPWRLQFEEGSADVADARRNGQRMDIASLEHWGLSGSEIRGVQIHCVEAGCYVRFALWEPEIRGAYTYQIHCWREPEFLYASVDPEAGRVLMGTQVQDNDVDMHDRIEFIASDEQSVTVFVHETELPTGSSTSRALLDFDIFFICVYDDGSVHETFEIGEQ